METTIAQKGSKLFSEPIATSAHINRPQSSIKFEQKHDEDEFVSAPLEEETEQSYSDKTEKKPWYKRLLGTVIDKTRNFWKTIRRFNPITQLFNFIEYVRCSGDIRKATRRNGAKTEEEIKKYHESLKFDEENPNENAIFRTHFTESSKPKPLVALFLGNGQTHLTSGETAGLNELYNRLKKNKDIDVVIFRVGHAVCDLRNRFLGGDCSLNTDVVFQHTSNVIEDIMNSRGEFNGRQKPSQVILTGYSFGGGTVDKLLREKWNKIGKNIPTSTACIDPITLGAYNLGCPIEKRPPHSLKHLVFYQQNSTAINGSHQNETKPQDIIKKVPNADHESIDNDESVLSSVERFVKSEIKRVSK